jgi:hypothetical protein
MQRKKPILSNIKNIATTKFFNIQSMDVAFSNGEKRQYERLKPDGDGAVVWVFYAYLHYRDLCINRSNHQQPTFHPLGDFLNPALALLIKNIATTKFFNIQSMDVAFSNGEKRQYERLKPDGDGAVLVVPMLSSYKSCAKTIWVKFD